VKNDDLDFFRALGNGLITVVVFWILLLGALALLGGCATVDEYNDAAKLYRKEMRFSVNGNDFTGVANLDDSIGHKIKFKTERSTARARISTCARDVHFNEPGRERFEYRYYPNQYERDTGCFLQISLLDKDGAHAWGLLDFRREGDGLAADIDCNGTHYQARGAFLCQSKAGLIQTISFDSPALMAAPKRCEAPTSPDGGKTWFLAVTRGFCNYRFAAGGQGLRFRTYGYDGLFFKE
jgi:hypothetical protein